MEYFKRSFHIITRNIFNNKINENDHYVEYSKMDAYLNYIHKVLVWEDPTITWVTLGALNFLFWYVTPHFDVHNSAPSLYYELC